MWQARYFTFDIYIYIYHTLWYIYAYLGSVFSNVCLFGRFCCCVLFQVHRTETFAGMQQHNLSRVSQSPQMHYGQVEWGRGRVPGEASGAAHSVHVALRDRAPAAL